MKKVCLLGDSIRMGYDSYVKDILKDYEVYYDDLDNGRFIHYTIWMFNQLNIKYGPFDFVHVNTGYWDMNKEGPKGEPQTEFDEYEKAFNRLIGLIKETGATPIIANCVPVKDELLKINMPYFVGYNNDIVLKYNKVLEKVSKENNAYFNDLYSLLLDDSRYYKCEDSIHLTEEGYIKCAKRIADIIRNIDK